MRYSPQIEKSRFNCEVLGVLTNRGKSIPVFDTAFLIDAVQGNLDQNSSVLVFEIEGTSIGFAVQKLNSIEPIIWENKAPHVGYSKNLQNPEGSEPLIVEVGHADDKRVLDVINFLEIAAWKIKQQNQQDQRLANSPPDAVSEIGDAIA